MVKTQHKFSTKFITKYSRLCFWKKNQARLIDPLYLVNKIIKIILLNKDINLCSSLLNRPFAPIGRPGSREWSHPTLPAVGSMQMVGQIGQSNIIYKEIIIS